MSGLLYQAEDNRLSYLQFLVTDAETPNEPPADMPCPSFSQEKGLEGRCSLDFSWDYPEDRGSKVDSFSIEM